MGCSSSAEVKVVTSPALPIPNSSPKPATSVEPLLTSAEMKILQKSWGDLSKSSDLSSLGKKVFLHAFQLRPEMKSVFPFGNSWGDDLLKHPKFQAHAQSFMVVIESCVENVDCLTTPDYTQTLLTLGGSHISREGFTKENFDAFCRSILAVWHELLKSCDKEVEQIWCKLLEYITKTMRTGYEDALKKSTNDKEINHGQWHGNHSRLFLTIKHGLKTCTKYIHMWSFCNLDVQN